MTRTNVGSEPHSPSLSLFLLFYTSLRICGTFYVFNYCRCKTFCKCVCFSSLNFKNKSLRLSRIECCENCGHCKIKHTPFSQCPFIQNFLSFMFCVSWLFGVYVFLYRESLVWRHTIAAIQRRNEKRMYNKKKINQNEETWIGFFTPSFCTSFSFYIIVIMLRIWIKALENNQFMCNSKQLSQMELTLVRFSLLSISEDHSIECHNILCHYICMNACGIRSFSNGKSKMVAYVCVWVCLCDSNKCNA